MIPASWIMLCEGVELVDGENTKYFANEDEREAYMLAHAITVNPQGGSTETQKKLQAQMYKRVSDRTMRVSVDKSTLLGCDYMVMYVTSANKEGKKYYCFVDDVRYVSEGISEVDFHEDVIQTWISSCTFTRSQVKRLTKSTDALFDNEHKTPDMYNGGSLNCVLRKNIKYHQSGAITPDIVIDKDTQGLYLCLCTTDFVYPQTSGGGYTCGKLAGDGYPRFISGKPDPYYYYFAKLNNATAVFDVYRLAYACVNTQQTQSCFISLSVLPGICVPQIVENYIGTTHAVVCVTSSNDLSLFSGASDWLNKDRWLDIQLTGMDAREAEWSISFTDIKAALFEGYHPKNRKLYNSPYWQLRIKDNQGGYIDLNPQDLKHVYNSGDPLDEEHLRFGGKIYGILNSASICFLLPKYNDSENETNYKLTLPSLPQVPLTKDTFAEWFNQAKITMPITLATSVPRAMATGGYSLLGDVGQMVTQGIFADRGSAPIQSGATWADTIVAALDMGYFTVEVWSLSEGDARIIDDYFTAYGYMMDRFITPSNNTFYSLGGRPVFRYVQTANCVPHGDIPGYARQAIAKKFDSGMRIWLPQYYMDYSQDNSVGFA